MEQLPIQSRGVERWNYGVAVVIGVGVGFVLNWLLFAPPSYPVGITMASEGGIWVVRGDQVWRCEPTLPDMRRNVKCRRADTLP